MDDTFYSKFRLFRPSWVPETTEPEKPVKFCPFMRPEYNGSQPECLHRCALYDDQNNRCGLYSWRTGECAIDRFKTRFPNAVDRMPAPNKKP